jgi:hypothetical protein
MKDSASRSAFSGSFSQGRSLPLADRVTALSNPVIIFADAARYRTSSKLKVELEEIPFLSRLALRAPVKSRD